MSTYFVRILRGGTRAAAALALLALPLAANAAVEIDPGYTESNLMADGYNTLEKCDATDTEACAVAADVADNEIGALVNAQILGAGAASGEVYTDFSISGDSEAVLLGSSVAARVDVDGLLTSLAVDAIASVDVSLHVMDMTAGVLVGAQTVANHTIVNGLLPVSHSNAVVIPVALTRGHDYRISLIIAAEAVGSAVELGGGSAQSAFINTASWMGLSVTAGQDPFGAIADLEDRVSDVEDDVAWLIPVVRQLVADLDALEALVDRIANALRDLQQTVAELREDFDNHTHTYLTGKGVGHNNTEATTTLPMDGASIQPVTTPGNSGNTNPNASSSESSASEKSCSRKDRRRNRC